MDFAGACNGSQGKGENEYTDHYNRARIHNRLPRLTRQKQAQNPGCKIGKRYCREQKQQGAGNQDDGNYCRRKQRLTKKKQPITKPLSKLALPLKAVSA